MNSLTARTAPENLARCEMIWLPNQPNWPGTAPEPSLTVVGESGISNRVMLSADVPDENWFFDCRETNLLSMAVPHHGGKIGVLNTIQTLNPGQNYVSVRLVDSNRLQSTANLWSGQYLTNQVGGNWLVVGDAFQLTPPSHVEIGTNSTAPVFSIPDYVAPARSVTQLPPAWLNGLVSRINSFSAMRKNWDTYGSKPIAKHAILKAIDVAKLLAKIATRKRVTLTHAPFAAPTSLGGVLFEIVNASRELHIEIEDDRLDSYRIFQSDAASEEAEREFSVDDSHLPEVLAWIVDGQ